MRDIKTESNKENKKEIIAIIKKELNLSTRYHQRHPFLERSWRALTRPTLPCRPRSRQELENEVGMSHP